MQIQININIKDSTAISDIQAMFIKSELESIVRRFQDPSFLTKQKEKLRVDKLVGGVGYPHYDLSIQHVVNEQLNDISL